MHRTLSRPALVVLTLLGAAAWAAPLMAGQQASSLSAADAKGWIGLWALTINEARGPQALTLRVTTDESGKVVAVLDGRGYQIRIRDRIITDISRKGNNLVLKYKQEIALAATEGQIMPTPLSVETIKAGKRETQRVERDRDSTQRSGGDPDRGEKIIWLDAVSTLSMQPDGTLKISSKLGEDIASGTGKRLTETVSEDFLTELLHEPDQSIMFKKAQAAGLVVERYVFGRDSAYTIKDPATGMVLLTGRTTVD